MRSQYNYNEAYLYPKHPCSAQELYRMSQQRNPIIETDKNVERHLIESKAHTAILNQTMKLAKENANSINRLIILTEENQKVADKQFKITLIVSIIAALFAAGSFIVALF